MTIEPHPVLEIVRPDEVAECWDGVPSHLIGKLWACVEGYKAPRPEESEEPCYGMDCVADFWDNFNRDEKLLLNELAERN